MPDPNYEARVSLALEALAGIAWLDRLGRCRDPRRPRREELWPRDDEREGLVEKIVMADGLAAGCPSARPGSLAAVARALAILALAPGGAVFLGRRYRSQERPDGFLDLVVEPDQGLEGVPRTLRETLDHALELARKARA